MLPKGYGRGPADELLAWHTCGLGFDPPNNIGQT